MSLQTNGPLIQESSGGRALPPAGQPDLVLGHEMLGRVTAGGTSEQRV